MSGWPDWGAGRLLLGEDGSPAEREGAGQDQGGHLWRGPPVDPGGRRVRAAGAWEDGGEREGQWGGVGRAGKARLSTIHLRQRAGGSSPITPILCDGLWSP